MGNIDKLLIFISMLSMATARPPILPRFRAKPKFLGSDSYAPSSSSLFSRFYSSELPTNTAYGPDNLSSDFNIDPHAPSSSSLFSRFYSSGLPTNTAYGHDNLSSDFSTSNNLEGLGGSKDLNFAGSQADKLPTNTAYEYEHASQSNFSTPDNLEDLGGEHPIELSDDNPGFSQSDFTNDLDFTGSQSDELPTNTAYGLDNLSAWKAERNLKGRGGIRPIEITDDHPASYN